MGRGLSPEQKAIIAHLEAELTRDLRDGDTFTQPYRGGWRRQRDFQGAFPRWVGRETLYRSLARLVARGQIRCALIRPWDCGGRFQLYPKLRLPLSQQRTRDIRLYAALAAPELDTLPAPGPVPLPVTRTENRDDVTLASQPIAYAWRGGVALAVAVAAAIRLDLRANKEIDPARIAALYGTTALIIEQKIDELKASGEYQRFVDEALASRDA